MFFFMSHIRGEYVNDELIVLFVTHVERFSIFVLHFILSNCLLQSANSEKQWYEPKSLDQTQDLIDDNAFVAITNLLL